ncbi:MAG: ATP-dependent helicase [Bacillota bacterium]|jgi:DNA helicase-2/ATP-dependent DNA helicase PcrA
MLNLNKQQQLAVVSEARAILVIAGAGSGKTRVLVERIRHLLQQGVPPHAIMAVTFTNKAANEMKERLQDIYQTSMWIGTFHALCARILRIESDALPFANNYLIYDADDSKSLLKKVIRELDLDDKKFTPQAVSFAISEAKNKLMTADKFAAAAQNDYEKRLAEIYFYYQKRLRENNALDFDDILLETWKLFSHQKQVLNKYRERFRHLLVDEYQDTNRCQYLLIKMLAGENNNLFVVGDPDQSIYRWRGADINNILDFEKDYPQCQVIKLVENYRSTQNILSAANSVIANNSNRKPKELFTDNGAGEKLILHIADTDRNEAAYVIYTVKRLRDKNYRYSDCAVLYRTHSQSRALEEECIRYGLPYRIFGGMKFYDRKEVKDCIAYLRAVVNPLDKEAWGRIYNQPRRGIGSITWERVLAAAEEQSIVTVLENIDDVETLSTAPKRKLTLLAAMFKGFRDFRENNNSIAALLKEILQESGYQEDLFTTPEGEERWENIEQLFNIAAEFDLNFVPDEEYNDALVAFLAQVALATDLDDLNETDNFITFMTLHSAKGLEFPIIFMPGMEEGLFPHKRSLMSVDKDDLEEERRLCYVGMTRARERLFFVAANKRYTWDGLVSNDLSRFLAEIPPELIEKTGIKKEYVDPHQPKNVNIFVSPKPSIEPVIPASLVNVGDKIEHSKFGVGIIVSMCGADKDLQVGVAFPDLGIKQLMWCYAPVKKVN